MFQASLAMTKDPIGVSPEANVYEAIAIMVENHVTGLPVINADGTLAGVISEKDVLKLLYDLKDDEQTVAHYMTEDVVTFDEADSLIDITESFISSHFRRVFITANGKMTGVVSRRDVIRFILHLRHKNEVASA